MIFINEEPISSFMFLKIYAGLTQLGHVLFCILSLISKDSSVKYDLLCCVGCTWWLCYYRGLCHLYKTCNLLDV